jgi:hypothetical protein
MYLIGERCRRTGDLDMAENCYQETKLLCPGCDYARKAERRLRQVRALRTSEREDIGEEAEPAKEEMESAKQEPSMSNWISDADWADADGWYYDDGDPRERMRQVERLAGKRLLFEADVERLAEAKTMYYVGERCRRGGDMEMAYRCYENAYRTCPQCRHGKKAQLRMRQINDERASGREKKPRNMTSDLDILFVSGEFLSAGNPRPQPDPDWFCHRLFEDSGRYAEQPLPPPVNIEIIEEESRPMLDGDAEESDASVSSITQSEPPTLYIAPPVRNLKLGEEQEETAPVANAACEDLSDWLPQAIRLLRGAGSLRIDATRLGRLMSRGEGAVRALGCAVVYECGRTLVVYPARP